MEEHASRSIIIERKDFDVRREVIAAGSKISLVIRILFFGLQTSTHFSLGRFTFIQIYSQTSLRKHGKVSDRADRPKGWQSLMVYFASAPEMHAKQEHEKSLQYDPVGCE